MFETGKFGKIFAKLVTKIIKNHPQKKCFWIILRRKKMLEQNAQDFWWIPIANYVEFTFIFMVRSLNPAKWKNI